MSEATDSPLGQTETLEDNAPTATPVPEINEEPPADEEQPADDSQQVETTQPTDTLEEEEPSAPVPSEDLPRPGNTAPLPPPIDTERSEDNPEDVGYPVPAGGGYTGPAVPVYRHENTGAGGGHQIPLTINQLAIVASAQNKLPISKVKSIVLRVGRHTESSLQKSGKWYKNENYVDKNTYSWKNMPLFEEYQRHLWTREGTVRDTFKK